MKIGSAFLHYEWLELIWFETLHHLHHPTTHILILMIVALIDIFYVFQFTEIHLHMGRLRFLLYGCGLRFFSWTRKILSFLGDWRVSGGRVYFPLCGSLPRGAVIGWPFISLEVFDWHGGRCCCAVFVGLHNLCLSSWVCHVGLLFWLSIHFGGVIWLARWGGACFVVSRTGIQSCGSSVAVIFRSAVPRGVVILVNHSYRRTYLIGTCGVCMAMILFFMVPCWFLSVLSSYRPPIQTWVPIWIDEIVIYLILLFFCVIFRLGAT